MKIHIAKIGEPLPGEGLRERRMTRFAECLVARGHEVIWWTSDWSHQKLRRRDVSLVDISRERGIKLNLISSVGYRSNVSIMRFFHHWQYAIKTKRRLDLLPPGGRPDILWVCFPTIPAAILLARWAKKNGVPIIFDVRDISPDVFISRLGESKASKAKLLMAPLYTAISRAFSGAAGLVGVSKGYLDWALELAGRMRPYAGHSSVLPLGYKTPGPSLGHLTSLSMHKFDDVIGSGEGKLNFVFAGSFGSSYDVVGLIREFGIARDSGLSGNLFIAGGGSNAGAIEELAARSKGVHFLGWLSPQELAHVLDNSHVGVMAYSAYATQGLPNKIYEYMAHGLAIINGLSGEAESFIKDNELGINYQAGSPGSLSEALLTMDSDHDSLWRCRERSLALFRAKYDEKEAMLRMAKFCESTFESTKYDGGVECPRN